MKRDCPFCDIVAGADSSTTPVILQDERVVAFPPLEPATRGHTLVIPTRHVSHVTDLTPDEARELAGAVHRVARAVRSAVSPDGINIIQSNGEAATQSVPHVHVHVVPRWRDDRMTLSWPTGAAEDEDAQRATADTIRAVLPTQTEYVTPEDRRQHLSFIQAVITRMSQASSSSKTWLLPVVTLTYGYAITEKDVWPAILGMAAILIFGTLDANYLKQERAFRGLYDRVAAGGDIPAFAMNPTLAATSGRGANYWPDGKDLKSWAVAPVYFPLLIVGLAIVAWVACG